MNDFKMGRRNHKNKKNLYSFSAIIVLIAFFIIFSGEISNFFYHASSPIQRSLAFMGSKSSVLFESLKEKSFLVSENQELKKENRELVAEIVVLRELEDENQKLRDVLKLNENNNFDLIFARISSFIFLEDSFLIDKGKKDNVSINMPVITEKGVVVGKVFETYDNFSKIKIITHKESDFFNAEIQGKEAMGIIKGEGKLNLVLDLISKEKEINQGDFIVTLGQVFPGGLPVGKIKEVIRSDADPFQKARISIFFNPTILKNVFIITNY